MILKLIRPIIFLIGFGLVIGLSILWIVSIISFFYATPFTAYIFSNSFVSFLASTNILLLISIPLFSLLMYLINKVFKKTVATSLHLRAGLWGLWIVNFVSLLFFGISESRNFNMATVVTDKINVSELRGDTIFINKLNNKSNNSLMSFGPLKLADNGLSNYHTHYRFVRSGSDQVEIEQIKHSRGRTSAQAEKYARAIDYKINATENTLNLPSSFAIAKGSKYRGQEVEIIIKVPVGKTIKMGRGVSNRVYSFEKSKSVDNPWRDDGRHFWTMEEDGFVARDYIKENNQRKSYDDFEDFTQVQIDGQVVVDIEQSDNYSIKIKSKNEYLEDLEVDQIGDILTIQLDRNRVHSPPVISIKMPSLLSYDGSKTDDVNISGFTQSEMSLKSEGRHHLKALVNVDSLTIRQENNTKFDLRGKGQYLKAILGGQSRLDADRYTVRVADLKMQYNNNATLSVLDTLYRRGESSRTTHGLKIEGEPALVDLKDPNKDN